MHGLHFYYSFQSIGEVHGETVLKDRTSILCDRDKCKSRKTELARKYKNQSLLYKHFLPFLIMESM